MKIDGPDPVLVCAMVVTALALATPVHSVGLVPLALFVVPIATDRVLTYFATRSVSLAASANPEVVAVGDRVNVSVRFGGHRSGVARLARFELTLDGTATSIDHGRCSVSIEAATAGLVEHFDVAIRARCLYLASFGTVRRVALTKTLHCGPRLGVHERLDLAPSIGGLSTTREYVPGDHPGRVNWSATARTGTLLVRSVADDDEEHVVLVDSTEADDLDLDWLSLPGDAVMACWEQHRSDVRLVTRELAPDGANTTVVDEWVNDRTELLRRLARVRRGPMPIDHFPEAIRFTPLEPAG